MLKTLLKIAGVLAVSIALFFSLLIGYVWLFLGNNMLLPWHRANVFREVFASPIQNVQNLKGGGYTGFTEDWFLSFNSNQEVVLSDASSYSSIELEETGLASSDWNAKCLAYAKQHPQTEVLSRPHPFGFADSGMYLVHNPETSYYCLQVWYNE